MIKKGILELHGAHCASCAYTIEHVGRKIKGIKSVRVYAGDGRVEVGYDGDPVVLDKVAEIVKNIGYSADVVQTNVDADSDPSES